MIARYLDLSTCHLTQREVDTAESVFQLDGPRVITHEYGLFVNVQHDDVEEHDEAMRAADFPNLLAVSRYARSLGEDVHWINFDADGETLPALPTHDWSAPAGIDRSDAAGPC